MNPSELQFRLVFNNGVLSKIQEGNGLNRSWVLLKPHFQTICDVVSYILHSFELHDSCPHGIILFGKTAFIRPSLSRNFAIAEAVEALGDGFVLPEFESISVLKDNDLISVKRKETRLLHASKAVKDRVVEKLPLPSGVKLLANEFDKQTGGHQSESEKDEDEGVEIRSPVQNDTNGNLPSKKKKSSSKLESAKKKRKVQTISCTVQKKHARESEHITKPKKKRKHESRSNQNALCSPEDMENEHDESNEDNNQASAMLDKTNKVEHNLSDILLQLSNLTRQVNRATLCQKKKRVQNRSEQDEAKKDESPRYEWRRQNRGGGTSVPSPTKGMEREVGQMNACTNEPNEPEENISVYVPNKCDRQQPVKDMTIDTGPKKKIVANIIRHHDEDSHRQQVEMVKDSEENHGASAFDVNPTPNGTWEDHSGAKNVSDNQIVKEDVWEKIIEAVSAKKARLMQEDNWNRKETGAKWPSSCYNEVQDEAEKVASKLSSQKPPTPGLTRGMARLRSVSSTFPSISKRDVWEEITEAASAKKARLMQEDNWNKKETGAKWPSSCYNEVQDDAEKVASKLSSQKPPTPGLILANSKRDVWEEITEAASAKKTQLMLEDNWNKKATGAKWPSSSHNRVQDDSKKVASKLSNPRPPSPGVANSKRDVWEEITEAASIKKARLMLEDNWSKKETGAKWPSSLYNQVQNDAEKVASKLSSQKPPTPHLANGKRDVWEEITEAASAKKAQLMLEDNWNKKETGAKWPSSLYNQVQDDAKKVASELSNQKPPALGFANGEKDVREEITEAASAKKAQLMQENNWNKKETGAKWPSSLYIQVQDDAKKVASDPSIQKPPSPGLASGEKDVSKELTKATSAKKAQLMQEDRWSKKETAAAMVLQQLKKQCHWPRVVVEQSQPAKPSESARAIRAQARARDRALSSSKSERIPS